MAFGLIYSRQQLITARAAWKDQGKKVVFTNGCYDILHPGHIRLLENARSLGDILILALNTDASVQRLKGPNRPLIHENERAELAAALQAVRPGPAPHANRGLTFFRDILNMRLAYGWFK
jgi:cytidyltransferase-like protein